MTTPSEETPITFTTTFPMTVYVRRQPETYPEDRFPSATEWQEYDHGPGVISIPPGLEINVRVQHLNNDDLRLVVEELAECKPLRFLNLSENRNITDDGLVHLRRLPQLFGLNLSSCDLTKAGLPHLGSLGHLQFLDLSYCNRINDNAVPALKGLTHLTFLDLKGVLKLKSAGVARLQRRHLTVHH